MKENKKGFTLIELLVAVLIIGILAAIALPQYRLVKEKAKFSEYINYVKPLYEAQQRYYLVNGKYAEDIKDLDITLPIDSCPRTYVETKRLRYDCEGFFVGVMDYFSNVQSGKSSYILYVAFLKDYTAAGTNFYAGRKYCWAHSSQPIAQKVCESYGEKIGEASGGYIYYLMR